VAPPDASAQGSATAASRDRAVGAALRDRRGGHRKANGQPRVRDSARGVDHRDGDVLVAEEILQGPDVVSGFQKMRRERMPERMAARWFANRGGTHGDVDGALDDRRMVVARLRPIHTMRNVESRCGLGRGPD
jgi:hypothetical protein